MFRAALALTLAMTSCVDGPSSKELAERSGPGARPPPHSSRAVSEQLERGLAGWRRISEDEYQPTEAELRGIIDDLNGAIAGGTPRKIDALRALTRAYRTLIARSEMTTGNDIRDRLLKPACAELISLSREDVYDLISCLQYTDEKRAAEAYERLLASQPGNTEAHRMLARHLAEEGRLDEALDHARFAVEHEDRPLTRAGYRGELIYLLRSAGRVDEAAQEEQKLLEDQ
jgi:tetratricopeptide (TPR) repeat protein